MEDAGVCKGCGMRSTDWWQCQCEEYVTQQDEAAREADISEALAKELEERDYPNG